MFQFVSIAVEIICCLSALNVLLIFMNIRSAMGAQDGASGLDKAIVILLIESGTICAASFAPVGGPWASGNSTVQVVAF